VVGADLIVSAPAGLEAANGGGVADLVRDVAVDQGWPLRRLVPRTASLEQAYLRLTAAAGAPVGPTGPAGALPGPGGPYGQGPGPSQSWPQPQPQPQQLQEDGR
jgi:hypothetical protein